MLRLSALVACFTLAACGGTESTALDGAGIAPDAGFSGLDASTTGDDAGSAPDAAPAAMVEVGTGSDTFIPVTEGELIPFVIGPQGGGRFMGYHLWGAVRAHGLSPRNAMVLIELLDASDRSVRATQLRKITLEPSSGSYIAYGIAARLDDCCLAAGKTLILRGEVTDENGQSAADERHIQTQTVCPQPNDPSTSVCP